MTHNITEYLNEPLDDLVHSLGGESRVDPSHPRPLSSAGDTTHFPSDIDFFRDPYPLNFYRTQNCLAEKRSQLKAAILDNFDYEAKKQLYPAGSTVQLVSDLSRTLEPLCKEPHPVNPILVATLLVKIGLERFCQDADKPLGEWTLERALGWNAEAADAAIHRGNRYLFEGNWKEALKAFTEAISLSPAHLDALNMLGYVYATHAPEAEEGFAYAKRAGERTPAGDHNEAAALETLGWAYYRQKHNLIEAERYIRAALNLMHPGQKYYITCVHHLMLVLKEAGKTTELNELYKTVEGSVPLNDIDKASYKEINELMRVST